MANYCISTSALMDSVRTKVTGELLPQMPFKAQIQSLQLTVQAYNIQGLDLTQWIDTQILVIPNGTLLSSMIYLV